MVRLQFSRQLKKQNFMSPERIEMKYHKWKPSEKAYLRTHYPSGSIDDIAAYLGINRNAVKTKAAALGVSKWSRSGNIQWTDELKDYLIKNYPRTNTKQLAADLGMSYASVKHKAYSLGLQKLKLDGESRVQRTVRQPPPVTPKNGIYKMEYFEKIPNYYDRPLRKQEGKGIPSYMGDM